MFKNQNFFFQKDIYTFCSNRTYDEDDFGEEIPQNNDNCARCDLRPTVDQDAVIVECFGCQEASISSDTQVYIVLVDSPLII